VAESACTVLLSRVDAVPYLHFDPDTSYLGLFVVFLGKLTQLPSVNLKIHHYHFLMHLKVIKLFLLLTRFSACGWKRERDRNSYIVIIRMRHSTESTNKDSDRNLEECRM
jgi:hypothetical protein